MPAFADASVAGSHPRRLFTKAHCSTRGTSARRTTVFHHAPFLLIITIGLEKMCIVNLQPNPLHTLTGHNEFSDRECSRILEHAQRA